LRWWGEEEETGDGRRGGGRGVVGWGDGETEKNDSADEIDA